MEQVPSFQVRSDTFTYDQLYKLRKILGGYAPIGWIGVDERLQTGYLRFSPIMQARCYPAPHEHMPKINARIVKRIFKL